VEDTKRFFSESLSSGIKDNDVVGNTQANSFLLDQLKFCWAVFVKATGKTPENDVRTQQK